MVRLTGETARAPGGSSRVAPPCPSCDAVGGTWLSFTSDSGAFQCLRCRCVWMAPSGSALASGVDAPATPVGSPMGSPIGAQAQIVGLGLGAVGVAAAIIVLGGLWLAW